MTAVPRTVAEVPVILRENTSQLPTLTKLHPEPTIVGTLATMQVAERLAGSPAGFSHVSWGLGQVAQVQQIAWKLSLGPTLARSSPIDESLNWPKRFRL